MTSNEYQQLTFHLKKILDSIPSLCGLLISIEKNSSFIWDFSSELTQLSDSKTLQPFHKRFLSELDRVRSSLQEREVSSVFYDITQLSNAINSSELQSAFNTLFTELEVILDNFVGTYSGYLQSNGSNPQLIYLIKTSHLLLIHLDEIKDFLKSYLTQVASYRV